MKKIAIVIGDLGMPGGAEKVAADLATEFHQRGHDVTVITFEEKQKSGYLQTPAKHLHLSMPSREGNLLIQLKLLAERVWTFRKVFKQQQFTHIFSFLESANLPCALASPLTCVSVHIDPDAWTKRQERILKFAFKRAYKVIALTNSMQTKLEHRLSLDNVVRIYNPVMTDLVHQRAKENISLELPFILAVGRLNHLKRFDRLIDAYAQAKISEKCQLVILGEGELRQSLEQQINAYGLKDRVLLLGYESNPYKYMTRAEYLVMSSDTEAYPVVLIEALSLGCPVLSTDCPSGPREIIRDGENGLLVAVDELALAGGMQRLCADPQLRERLSRQAPSSVQANDIRQVADAWLAV
ncbi:MAG: glycosyltransferase family 4 protein [Thiothrix sp.]|nr:MAG: glycosyltransferase family 4 protein [Thiothrix sp.]